MVKKDAAILEIGCNAGRNLNHLYQSGFSPGGSLRHPGSLIRALAIEDSINQGILEWDFLKAAPDSYKYRWSSQVKDLVALRITRPRSKEALYSTAAKIVDGLRQVKRALT